MHQSRRSASPWATIGTRETTKKKSNQPTSEKQIFLKKENALPRQWLRQFSVMIISHETLIQALPHLPVRHHPQSRMHRSLLQWRSETLALCPSSNSPYLIHYHRHLLCHDHPNFLELQLWNLPHRGICLHNLLYHHHPSYIMAEPMLVRSFFGNRS